MHSFRGLTAFLLTAQFALSPLAFAKQAEVGAVHRIRDLVKATGLGTTPDLTAGEFYIHAKENLSPEARQYLDGWVAYHRNEKMPKMNNVKFKDKEGREQIRLVLSSDGQNLTISTSGPSDKQTVHINDVAITDDIQSFEMLLATLVAKDHRLAEMINAKSNENKMPDFVLSKLEFESLSKNKRAEFLASVRLVSDSATDILSRFYGDRVDETTAALPGPGTSRTYFASLLLGQEASAAKTGAITCPPIRVNNSCVVGGWVSKYAKDLSCGGKGASADDLTQQLEEMNKIFPGLKCDKEGYFPCNPLVYGLDRSNPKKPICADARSKDFNLVTEKVCEKKSPLMVQTHSDAIRGISPDGVNKQKIIDTWLKYASKDDLSSKIIDGNKVEPNTYKFIKSYLAGLNKVVVSAKEVCALPEGNKCIQKLRPDQKSACELLEKRAFDLSSIQSAEPVIELPPPPPQPPLVVEKGADQVVPAPVKDPPVVANLPASAAGEPAQSKDFWGAVAKGFAGGVLVCLITKWCGTKTKTQFVDRPVPYPVTTIPPVAPPPPIEGGVRPAPGIPIAPPRGTK